MKVNKTWINQALKLKPQEKFFVIETLARSLDEPNLRIEKIWMKEAKARLQEHRKGKTKDLTVEEVLGEPL